VKKYEPANQLILLMILHLALRANREGLNHDGGNAQQLASTSAAALNTAAVLKVAAARCPHYYQT
jgi:hypothetical protein